jgi:hypothetical protein
MLGHVSNMLGEAEEDIARDLLGLTDGILKGTHRSLLMMRHWEKLGQDREGIEKANSWGKVCLEKQAVMQLGWQMETLSTERRQTVGNAL